MADKKNDQLTPEPQENQEPPKEPFVPASRKKRIAAWIGVIFMVLLVIIYSYSLATGAFLSW